MDNNIKVTQATRASQIIGGMVVRHVGCAGLSDLHIHADVPVALRVNGVLRTVSDDIVAGNVLLEFAVESLGDAWRQAMHESADIGLSIGARQFRANFYWQQNQPALALRLLPEREPEPGDIPLNETILSSLSGHGLVLVTGATGSGKSTTLAAMLHHIHTHRSVHILTIEDPVEYSLSASGSLISRRELARDTPSFAAALRAALRQDPDVILIGELRDAETVALALTAAETGHLVLSSLHASDCVAAVSRLSGMFSGVTHEQMRTQLAQSLRLILSQRLLPRKGGGRIAAIEVLKATDAVTNLIRGGKFFQLKSVMQTSLADGMLTMNAAVARLKTQGLVAEISPGVSE